MTDKERKKLAREFFNIFGDKFNNYWDMFLGFDVVKFSDEFFPGMENEEGISLSDLIKEKYGERGHTLIAMLIDDDSPIKNFLNR